jgi:hypothetical protein
MFGRQTNGGNTRYALVGPQRFNWAQRAKG